MTDDNYTPHNPTPTAAPCDGQPYALQNDGTATCLTSTSTVHTPLAVTGGLPLSPDLAFASAVVLVALGLALKAAADGMRFHRKGKAS